MDWQAQFSTMKRWFYRVRDSNNPDCSSVFTVSSDNIEDYYRAFFTTCYHLKDALKNQGILDAEQLINSNLCLQIAGDISNLSKHSILTKSRTGDFNTKGTPKYLMVIPDAGATYFVTKFEISSNGKIYDAEIVMEDCMIVWTRFLTSKSLEIPEIKEENIYKYFKKWQLPDQESDIL